MVDSKLVSADVVEGEGWPVAHKPCIEDTAEDAIDLDADAADAGEAAATPAPAASTCAKALPEPTERRPTRGRARCPKLSCSRRRAASVAREGPTVEPATPPSCATLSAPSTRDRAESPASPWGFGAPPASSKDTVRREDERRPGEVPADSPVRSVSGGVSGRSDRIRAAPGLCDAAPVDLLRTRREAECEEDAR